MADHRFINEWMAERNIDLAPGFAQKLRELAEAYKKNMAAV